jgi:hypothetical protein
MMGPLGLPLPGGEEEVEPASYWGYRHPGKSASATLTAGLPDTPPPKANRPSWPKNAADIGWSERPRPGMSRHG